MNVAEVRETWQVHGLEMENLRLTVVTSGPYGDLV